MLDTIKTILEYFGTTLGGYLFKRVLDKMLTDNPKTFEEAYKKAYKKWLDTHDDDSDYANRYEELVKPFTVYLTTGKVNDKMFSSNGHKELFELWKEEVYAGNDTKMDALLHADKHIIEAIRALSTQLIQCDREVENNIAKIIVQLANNTLDLDVIGRDIAEIKQYISANSLDSKLQATPIQTIDSAYVERHVITEGEDVWIDQILHKYKAKSLYDEIIAGESNKFLLLGPGQCGKTTELQRTVNLLLDNGDYCPILYRSYEEGRKLTKSMLPHGDFYYGKHIVLLIDAMDEFSENTRLDFSKWMKNYAEEHPDTIIVVSCRDNYSITDALSGFTRLHFEDLTNDDRKKIIENICGDNASALIDNVNSNCLKTPFEVNVIAQHYKDYDGEILTTKSQIYKSFILSKLHIDEQQQRPNGLKISHESYPFLLKLALLMQNQGGDFFLTYEQINKVIPDDDEKELLLRTDLLIKDSDGNWHFAENAYREYLSADCMSMMQFEQIKDFIEMGKTGILRENWLNVVVLLLSIWKEKESTQLPSLLQWMNNGNKEQLTYAEPNVADDGFRTNLLKSILDEYHKANRSIIKNDYNDATRLMAFGQTKASCEFIAQEIILNTSEYGIYLDNLYHLIENADFNLIDSVLRVQMIESIFTRIENSLNNGKDEHFLYVPLYNPYFYYSKKYVDRLIFLIGDKVAKSAVQMVNHLLAHFRNIDGYIDFVLAHEKDVCNKTGKDGVTEIAFREPIFYTLQMAKSRDAILKVLSYLSNKDFLRHNYSDASSISKTVCVLIGKLSMNQSNLKDAEIIGAVLSCYLTLRKETSTKFNNELFEAFRDFFSKVPNADEIYNDNLKKFLESNDFDEDAENVVLLLLDKEKVDAIMECDDGSQQFKSLLRSLQQEPDQKLLDYINSKIENSKIKGVLVPDWVTREKVKVERLFDYDSFKNDVLEKIHSKFSFDWHIDRFRFRTSVYVMRFIQMYGGESLDLRKVEQAINDRSTYQKFLLEMYDKNFRNETFYNAIPKDKLSWIQERLKDMLLALNITSYANIRISVAAFQAWISHKITLTFDESKKFLHFSNLLVENKGRNLFDFILSIAQNEHKVDDLKDYLLDCIENDQNIPNQILGIWYSWLLSKGEREVFPSAEAWIENVKVEEFLKYPVFDELLKLPDGRAFIEAEFQNLSIECQIHLIRESMRNKKPRDVDWICSRLPSPDSIKDDNSRNDVLQVLVCNGSQEALEYICRHFTKEYLKRDYCYTYKDEASADGLLFLLQKHFELNSNEGFSCFNYLISSIEYIAIIGKQATREKILNSLTTLAESATWLLKYKERIENDIFNHDNQPMPFENALQLVEQYAG